MEIEGIDMKYNDRCLTCKHWGGDRNKVKKEILKYGDVVMDWECGWPESGPCYIAYDWITIYTIGDACVKVGVSANFGCVLHEMDE